MVFVQTLDFYVEGGIPFKSDNGTTGLPRTYLIKERMWQECQMTNCFKADDLYTVFFMSEKLLF